MEGSADWPSCRLTGRTTHCVNTNVERHTLGELLEETMTVRPVTPAQVTLVEYYRCPDHLAAFETSSSLSATTGYFTFEGTRCFGRPADAIPLPQVAKSMPEVRGAVRHTAQGAVLPFDLAEVVTNLRQERYCHNSYPMLAHVTSGSLAEEFYYSLRPFMPVGVRKHLQRIRLRGWERIPFPGNPPIA